MDCKGVLFLCMVGCAVAMNVVSSYIYFWLANDLCMCANANSTMFNTLVYDCQTCDCILNSTGINCTDNCVNTTDVQHCQDGCINISDARQCTEEELAQEQTFVRVVFRSSMAGCCVLCFVLWVAYYVIHANRWLTDVTASATCLYACFKFCLAPMGFTGTLIIDVLSGNYVKWISFVLDICAPVLLVMSLNQLEFAVYRPSSRMRERVRTAAPYAGIRNIDRTSEALDNIDNMINHNIDRTAASSIITWPVIGRKAKARGNVKSVADGALEAECTICLSKLKEGGPITTLQCGHTFHSRCIANWNKTSPNCPLCRECSVFHIHDGNM